MDRYDRVEELVKKLEQGELSQAEFEQRISRLWKELEESADPAEQLLHEVLERTLRLTRGEISSDVYEQLIQSLRSHWLDDEPSGSH